jgi:hypothetical protein
MDRPPADQSDPFDIEQPGVLARYLREQGIVAADADVRTTILGGGVSNRAVLVERSDGPAWVVKQALAQLRTTVAWFSDPARIHREAAGLRSLEQLAPRGTITPLVFEDHTRHLLGMQAVPQPHQNWKTVLHAMGTPAWHDPQTSMGATPRGSALIRGPHVLRNAAPRTVLPIHGDSRTVRHALHGRADRGHLDVSANAGAWRLQPQERADV